MRMQNTNIYDAQNLYMWRSDSLLRIGNGKWEESKAVKERPREGNIGVERKPSTFSLQQGNFKNLEFQKMRTQHLTFFLCTCCFYCWRLILCNLGFFEKLAGTLVGNGYPGFIWFTLEIKNNIKGVICNTEKSKYAKEL